MRNLISGIRFWLLLFFALRLTGITHPPLEYNHNWRQVCGLMTARNFWQNKSCILFPETDDVRRSSGNVGMEFPLLNYLHALLSHLFGYSHGYGRLLNLVVSTLGIYAFYHILCLLDAGKWLAFCASLVLLFSIWFSFSRKTMPDTFSISLMFAGLRAGLVYIEKRGLFRLFVFLLLSSLAVLSKIPSLIYLLAFIVYILAEKRGSAPGRALLLASAPCFLSAFFWYGIWCRKLEETYGYWFISRKPFLNSIREIFLKYDLTLHNFTFHAFQGYLFFCLSLVGLILLMLQKRKKPVAYLLLIMGFFMVFVFRAGFHFYHHSYYIIPVVPVMAVAAGYAVARLPYAGLAVFFLAAGSAESLSAQIPDFFIPREEKYKTQLGGIMDSLSDRSDLILVNGNGNPQLLYLANRKGWSCASWELTEVRHIRKIISPRCGFIVVDRHAGGELKNPDLPLEKAFKNEDFIVYRARFAGSGRHLLRPDSD